MGLPAKVTVSPPPKTPPRGTPKDSKLLRIIKMVGRVLAFVNGEVNHQANSSGGQTTIFEFKSNQMPKQTRAELVREYARLSRRKKTDFATRAPQHLEPPAEPHISIATFEAWIDDLITDEYLNQYVAKHCGCEICKDNYDSYRKLKSKRLQRSEL